MSYVVLARKWRSAQFADIVGQTHIVRTLNNAIRAKRIHQAYLFTGSRGIGKTSIARIFAKVLRCESIDSSAEWLRSCDQCSSCKEIAAGSSVDVIEIDGASNNGVEAVREIRENAKYMPATGSRKIYIIDEVHMLTTAAFNALLKTLEEPPAHVVFIFATTEPHKIPATILSRCQRFDYRRPSLAQIHAHLTKIASAENIDAEPAGLTLLARAAEGSLRDSLSLLDQVIAFSGNKISAQAVRESIGLIESQTLLAILAALFDRKPLDAIAQVDQAYQRGHDLRVLTRNLIETLHGAILLKVGASLSQALEFSEEEARELGAIAAKRPLEEIELIFQVLHHGMEWIARSPQPKIVLDVLLVKCAAAEALAAVAAASGSAASGPTGGGLTTAKPAEPVTRQAAVLKTAPAVSATPTAPLAQKTASPQQAQALPPTAVTAPSAQAAPAPAGPRSWEGFIESVRQKRPLLASILEHAHEADIPKAAGATLTLAYSAKDVYYREQLQSRTYADQLAQLSRDYFGAGTRVQLDSREGGESLAAKKEREAAARISAAREAAKNHPLIAEARALFGGELGPIELTDSEKEDHANA